ncbi:MAG: A24 family peptidase [Pseudomonadota bacterium]
MITAEVLRVAIGLLGLAGAIAIVVYDWRVFRIPDFLSLPAVPLGLVLSGSLLGGASSFVAGPWHAAAAIGAAAALYLLRAWYDYARGIEAIGLGDVKLAAVAGAWVRPALLPYVFLVASLSALAYGAAVHAWRRDVLERRIPFGVFLAPSIRGVWIAAELYGRT